MKNDILSQPPGPAEQMGTDGDMSPLFSQVKIKISRADYAQHKAFLPT